MLVCLDKCFDCCSRVRLGLFNIVVNSVQNSALSQHEAAEFFEYFCQLVQIGDYLVNAVVPSLRQHSELVGLELAAFKHFRFLQEAVFFVTQQLKFVHVLFLYEAVLLTEGLQPSSELSLHVFADAKVTGRIKREDDLLDEELTALDGLSSTYGSYLFRKQDNFFVFRGFVAEGSLKSVSLDFF